MRVELQVPTTQCTLPAHLVKSIFLGINIRADKLVFFNGHELCWIPPTFQRGVPEGHIGLHLKQSQYFKALWVNITHNAFNIETLNQDHRIRGFAVYCLNRGIKIGIEKGLANDVF